MQEKARKMPMQKIKRFIAWCKEFLSLLWDCRHELTPGGVIKFILGVIVGIWIFIGLKSCYDAIDPGVAITERSTGECYLFDHDDWTCNGCCGNGHEEQYFLYSKKGQGVRKYESSKYKVDNFVIPDGYTKFCTKQ